MNRCVPLTNTEMGILIDLIQAERKRQEKINIIYEEVLIDIQAKLEVMKNAKQ